MSTERIQQREKSIAIPVSFDTKSAVLIAAPTKSLIFVPPFAFFYTMKSNTENQCDSYRSMIS